MGNRRYVLKLLLLIGTICAGCTLPASGAGYTPDSVSKLIERNIRSSKNIFLELYGKIWEERELDAKLADAIHSGIDEKMESMLYGTRSLQTLFRKSVAEEALAISIKKFEPHYAEFLQALEKRFAVENNGLVAAFYETVANDALLRSEDRKVRKYIRNSTKKILRNNAKNLQSQIAQSLGKKDRATYIKAGTTEIGISTQKFSEGVNSLIARQMKMPRTVSALGVGVLLGVTAFYQPAALYPNLSVLIGNAQNARGELETGLRTGLSEILTTNLPDYYWELMKNDVCAIFEEAGVLLRHNLEDIELTIRSPRY